MRPDVFPIPKTSSRPRERKSGPLRCHRVLDAIADLGQCGVPGCRGGPLQIHHSRVPGSGAAAGRKSGDDWGMLLCLEHHLGKTGVHAAGDELGWCRRHGIDPYALPARNRALLERPMP